MYLWNLNIYFAWVQNKGIYWIFACSKVSVQAKLSWVHIKNNQCCNWSDISVFWPNCVFYFDITGARQPTTASCMCNQLFLSKKKKKKLLLNKWMKKTDCLGKLLPYLHNHQHEMWQLEAIIAQVVRVRTCERLQRLTEPLQFFFFSCRRCRRLRLVIIIPFAPLFIGRLTHLKIISAPVLGCTRLSVINTAGSRGHLSAGPSSVVYIFWGFISFRLSGGS